MLQRPEALTHRVDQEDVPGHGIGPPPPDSGVQDESNQYGRGEDAIYEGNPTLSAQHRVVEPATG